jgi:hypothetical protein
LKNVDEKGRRLGAQRLVAGEPLAALADADDNSMETMERPSSIRARPEGARGSPDATGGSVRLFHRRFCAEWFAGGEPEVEKGRCY